MRRTSSAVSDVEDTEHRAWARSGLALTFYRWGCRQDPRTWDFRHLEGALEEALKSSRTWLLGEAWMRSVAMRTDEQIGSTGMAFGKMWGVWWEGRRRAGRVSARGWESIAGQRPSEGG